LLCTCWSLNISLSSSSGTDSSSSSSIYSFLFRLCLFPYFWLAHLSSFILIRKELHARIWKLCGI
jgi:hypothetical protein